MLTDGLKGFGEPPSDGGEEWGELCELASVDVELRLLSLSCLPPPRTLPPTSLVGLSTGLCEPERSMVLIDTRLGTGLRRLGDCLPGPVGVIDPAAPGEYACRVGGYE